MYKLEVSPVHTFLVGDDPWVVQNRCGTKLHTNMNAGRAKNDQAHHTTPCELVHGGKSFAPHQLMQDAINRNNTNRWRANNRNNGLILPIIPGQSLPQHSGLHNGYTRSVQNLLDTIYSIIQGSGTYPTQDAAIMPGIEDYMEDQIRATGSIAASTMFSPKKRISTPSFNLTMQ